MNFKYLLPWVFAIALLVLGHFAAAICIAVLIVICS